MGGNSRNRGRGGQQSSTPHRQQKHGSNSHAHSDHSPYGTPNHRTPNSSSGRGRGRQSRGSGRGTDTTPFTQHQHPHHNRSPWSSERRPSRPRHPGLADNVAESAPAGVSDYSRGSAAVAAEDRMLLVVGKDAKMPKIWELRVHPSQRFSRFWLSAVDRWVENMISDNTEQALLADIAAAAAAVPGTSAAAADHNGNLPPAPDEPENIDNDDYDFSDDDHYDDDHHHDDKQVVKAPQSPDDAAAAAADGSPIAAAAAAIAAADSEDDFNKSDDDAYDMLAYLNKLSINDSTTTAAAAEPDIDAVSCAATAGSSIATTSIRHRSSKQRRCNSSSSKVIRPSGDSAAELADAAAAAAGGGDGDDDSSGTSASWETDDGAVDLMQDHQQQQQQDSLLDADLMRSSDSSSGLEDQDQDHDLTSDHDGEDHDDDDLSEFETAVTAAEEQDLLCEPGNKLQPPKRRQQQQQQQAMQQQGLTTAAAGDPGASSSTAAAASNPAGSAAVKERRVRRGERKRQRWQQQQQQLLVSLRLERQGLTDKEAAVLSTWYTSSASAQHLSVSKLWLFNNSLGDAAAAAVAAMIGPDTTEIHLSHNQIGAEGAKALLAAVPTERAKGLKPLWLRIEWNQVDQNELKRFIEQDCSSRGLVVDIAQEVPISERSARTDSKGRELNLSWSLPWQQVHVQMPWLSCQRAPPAEAAVLQAAKAIWGNRGPAAAAAAAAGGGGSSSRAAEQQQQQQQNGIRSGGSSRGMGVVAAVDMSQPMLQTPPPPPPAAARPRAQPSPPPAAAGMSTPPTFTLQQPPPAPPAPRTTTTTSSPPPVAAAAGAATTVRDPTYQQGPLMLFLDTSALLSMLGCPGSVTSSTCFTLKLLQALAGSGRFGRGLPGEQQTFLVLADTVMKQLDSFKSAEAGVGGPVRRFLDKGLDEVGPKGLDFLTVLGSHEGEGLVVDRQAAVAGSRSPMFNGTTGQRSDLAIIEVGLFFRKELLAAAAAAMDEAGVGGGGESAEAQPVILVTNDNGQLQLAKAHGLPAFKLAGAGDFESQISAIIRSGGDLTSSTLRSLMAPAATAGLGSLAGRSLQDDFDGTVSCLRGLLEAYQDLSGVLGRINMLVTSVISGDEGVVLADVQQLLQEHQHVRPFEDSSGSSTVRNVVGNVCESQDVGELDNAGGSSVLECSLVNISAVERLLLGWEERAEKHHAPSRVLKWAGGGAGSRA